VNIFASLERLTEFQFRKVKFYSIHSEDKEVNEFYDFLNRMEVIGEIAGDLSNLLVWMEEIGENYGAIKSRFFRNESIFADVQALPPPNRQMELNEIIVEDLRLYCMVLNEHVVVLFNGGIKTTKKAQDCPNVSRYIKQANQAAEKIDELIRAREICWNSSQTDIIFNKNLVFEL